MNQTFQSMHHLSLQSLQYENWSSQKGLLTTEKDANNCLIGITLRMQGINRKLFTNALLLGDAIDHRDIKRIKIS